MNLENLFPMTAQTETFSPVRGNGELKVHNIDNILKPKMEAQI